METLRTGSRRSWVVAPGTTAAGQSSETLGSLAWAADGRRLVIGSTQGPASGIQILDTTKAAGAGNPGTVGPFHATGNLPPGRYQDPALLPDGTVVAISPRCWGVTTCPPDPHTGGALVTLDAATARVKKTLLSSSSDPGVQALRLAVDASGSRLAVEGNTSSGQSNLYLVAGGRLHPLSSTMAAFAWLPRLVGGAGATSRGANGRVEGTIELTGGPAPGVVRPEPGSVVIVGNGRRQTVSVGASGHFSVALPAGTYNLTGSTQTIFGSSEGCTAGPPVRVVARRTTHVNVDCSAR